MSALLIAFSLLLPAQADEWVPYTDGRFGGCYRTQAGQLYNCTRERDNKAAPEPEVPSGLPSVDKDAREELRAVKAELEELKRRQAEDDARRAQEAEKLSAHERQAQEAEQRDIDAAMEAYNAIEAAKDSVKMRELQEKTDACRGKLATRGYTVVGAGACKTRDGAYVNCPDC